jgi:micrococcal nuclease
MEFNLYYYKATVIKVYDADTITLRIDLGLDTFREESVRLASIDAPEIRGEEREAGLVSRDALREKILGKEVIILTERDKTGKYGRYIVTVYLPKEAFLTETNGNHSIDIEYLNVNDWLVENKYAEYKEY